MSRAGKPPEADGGYLYTLQITASRPARDYTPPDHTRFRGRHCASGGLTNPLVSLGIAERCEKDLLRASMHEGGERRKKI
jgi:hypothetical protein